MVQRLPRYRALRWCRSGLADGLLAARVAKRRRRVIIEGDYLPQDLPLAVQWAESGSNEENRSIRWVGRELE